VKLPLCVLVIVKSGVSGITVVESVVFAFADPPPDTAAALT
jgi:hypothetical protein